MNKYDGLELGARIFGVYLVVQGILGAIGAVMIGAVADFDSTATIGLADALLTSLAGVCLVRLAPGFVAWLRAKDELVRVRATEPAPARSRPLPWPWRRPARRPRKSGQRQRPIERGEGGQGLPAPEQP